MTVRAVATLLLAIAVGACGASPGPTPPSVTATVRPPSARGPATPAPASSTCPDETWPPFDLGGLPGLTAVALDRATIRITNRTGRTWSYRLAGWEPAQLETCRAFLEIEIERGPIEPRSAVDTTLGDLIDDPDVPITIAFWDRPCGEPCDRPPVGGMRIERSPLEPPSS